MMRHPTRLLAAVLFFAVLGLASADDVSAQERCRVLVRLAAEGRDTELWSESLEAALARSAFIGAVLRSSGIDSPREETARLGFDFAVDVRVSSYEAATERGVRVDWRIYAPSSGDPVDSGLIEGLEPDERSLPDLWLDLVQAADRAAIEIGDGGQGDLAILGPPGSVLSGLGDDELVIPPEGRIELRLPAPGTYRWRAETPGAMPESGVLTLTDSGGRIELSIRRLLKWRIESALLNATFPDLWISLRLLNDRFYLRAGFYQYLAGLSLEDEYAGYDPPLWVSYPLLQPGIGMGELFGPADAPLRAYAGATATARIAFPSGTGIFIDPVAPLSIGPQLGIEWRPIERWSFFAEGFANLYLFGDGRLMAASRKSGSGPFLFGATWYLEFPLMRFGARFAL
jgi:hypothetical protein